MKISYSIFLLLVLPVLSGCGLIEGIFKAGVWVGIFAVVGIAVLIFWLVSRSRRK